MHFFCIASAIIMNYHYVGGGNNKETGPFDVGTCFWLLLWIDYPLC